MSARPRLYVLKSAIRGHFYRVPADGARHGTWHEHAADATHFPDKHAAERALSGLRLRFSRHHRSALSIVPLHAIVPHTGTFPALTEAAA